MPAELKTPKAAKRMCARCAKKQGIVLCDLPPFRKRYVCKGCLAAVLQDVTDTSRDAREVWLRRVAAGVMARCAALGYTVPRYRITYSLLNKRNAIGACYDPEVSQDRTAEILIRLDRQEPLEVGAIVVHECAHAVVGPKEGHGPAFGKLARALGLVGPLTATEAGPDCVDWLGPLVKAAGPLPHAALLLNARAADEPKKQPARMMLVECPEPTEKRPDAKGCGYKMRIARKWLNLAVPVCPLPICKLAGQLMEVEIRAETDRLDSDVAENRTSRN